MKIDHSIKREREATPILCAIASCRKDITNEGCGYISERITSGPVCFSCANKWATVARDLPLAIQELHALALLYPDARQYEGEVRTRIHDAEMRVAGLRQLEQLFVR